MPQSLFDQTAARFTATLDEQIAGNTFRRGTLFLEAVRKWVPLGGFLLDYGCGPGRLAMLIAQSGYRVLGIDPSAKMIEQANKLIRGRADAHFEILGHVVQGLKANQYHAIICSSVIEYVLNADVLLASFNSALKPGGKLILSYANRSSAWRQYAEWVSRESPHFALQHNVWTFSSCRQRLERNGFKVLDGPIFFDSPFDKSRWFGWMRGSRFIGTLGLVVAEHRVGASQ